MSKKWLISVMATAMVFTLGLGAGCFNSPNDSSSSEPTQSSSSAAQATVSIDKTTASVSEYETVQLTATATGGEGDVIWTSSDNAIATVDTTGKVTGVKAGTVTITASYGTATATCAVTVTKAATPVMSVSANTVALDKGDEKSVTVSTKAGDKEIDGVEYEWYLEDDTKDESDIASISVSDDKKTATFTGLKQGTEVYQVSALVRGEVLSQTVTVKVVDNAITFTVANFEKGAEGFEKDLYLAQEDGKISSIKPEIAVYYKKVLKDDVTPNFTNSDDTVATMAADGTITALKEGTTSFTANVTIDGSEATLTLKVTVKRNEFKLADMQIETGRADANVIDLGAANIQGTIASVTLDGKDVYGSFEEGKLTLDAEKLPYLTKDLGDNKTFVIETEKAKYTATVGVYTLVLKTKDDFKLMNNELGYKAEEHDENTWLRWGGYYILGNDIDMENTGITSMFSYADMEALVTKHGITFGGDNTQYYGDNRADGRYNGFFGVFDGKGHTIDNLKNNYWGGGMFAQIGTTGIIKNVSFTNVELTGQAAIFCDRLGGTIENAYVQIKKVSGDSDYVFNKDGGWGTTRIINCFVEFPEEGSENTYLASVHEGYNSVQGVYTVGDNKGFNIYSTGGGTKNIYGCYGSYSELVAAGNDFSAWSTDFWKVEGGIPTPKNLDTSNMGNSDYTIETTILPVGGEVDVKGKYVAVELTTEAKALGITLDGNTVIVPDEEDLIGKSFKILVKNYFNADDYKEVTIQVTAIETYTVGDEESPTTTDLNSTVEYDFGDVASKIQGTLSSVKLAKGSLEAKYENGKLTVDFANASNVYGKQTLIAEFAVESEGVTTKIQQVSIAIKTYRLITTKDQLANMANYMQMDDNNAYADLKLGADIDMEGARAGLGTWDGSRFTHVFNGTFDGQGHTISNTTQGTNQGFISCNYGTVKNIVFMNVTVTGNGGFVATQNNGTVENVFVYGKVTTSGGQTWAPTSLIVSKNTTTGTVKNCVAVLSSSVQDGSHGGILAGWSQGKVENSISINLSGKTFHAVGTLYTANNACEEAAGDKNTVCKSWKAYYDVADDLTYGDWAKDHIAKIVASSKGVSAGKTEISRNDTLALTVKDAGFVKGYALETATTGVSVDNDGVVSVAADAVVGTSFKVVVTYLDGTTDNVELKVGKTAMKTDVGSFGDIDNRTAETAEFDLTGKDIAAEATIKTVYVNDVACDFNADGRKVTIAASALKIGENNVSIVFETAENTIYANATIIKASMIIKSAEDLDNFWAVAVGYDGTRPYKALYDGYYILGANIEYNKQWNSVYNWGTISNGGAEWGKLGNWNSKENGFAGVFDGRGYYISGMKFNGAGFFGNINTAGVVKNLALVNTNLTGNSGVFAYISSGTLENIYVQINNIVKGGSPNGTGLLAACAADNTYSTQKMKNVFVDVVSVNADAKADQVTDQRTSVLGRLYDGYNNAENVLVVTQGAKAWDSIGDVGQGTPNDIKAYTTRADMKAAEDWSIEGWSSVWTTDADGLPIFKTIKDAATVEITNTVTEAVAGMDYQVTVHTYGSVTYAVDNEDCTIDANGVLSIPDSIALDTKITVTVTNPISGDTDTIEVTIVNGEQVTLSTRFDVAVNKDSQVDVSEANLVEVYSATANGKNVAVEYADGKLTIPANTFGTSKTDWEKQTIEVIGRTDEKMVVVSVPVFAYCALTDLKLDNVGYYEAVNATCNKIYGYFRLMNDWDATGWAGNGKYDGGMTVQFQGTLDGQNHVVSNYTAGNNAGGIVAQLNGTIKNLILKNAKVSTTTGIVTTDNQGTIENVLVEATLSKNGAHHTPVAAIASKNQGTIKNCVVLYRGDAGTHKGIFAAWTTGTITNNVAIKLVNDSTVGAGEKDPDGGWSVANPTEQSDATNKIYTSFEAYLADKDNITQGAWAADYLKTLVGSYLKINGTVEIAKGKTAEYSLADTKFGCTWSLSEEVEGVSISTDGVLTVGADVTADSVTIKATDSLGNETTLTVAIWNEIVTKTFDNIEYDASKNTGATIDVSSVSEKEVTLKSVTVNGSAVNAVLAEGKVTIVNADLNVGPTANKVVLTLEDEEHKLYKISVEITKISLIIETADDFINMKNVFAANELVKDNSYGGYYVVNADIDLAGKQWSIYWNWTSARSAAGGWSQWNGGFIGTFDGRGHTISNFSMDSGSNSGIFGIVNQKSTVKNIAFENATLGNNQALFSSLSTGTFSNIYVNLIAANTGAKPNGWGLSNVNGDTYGNMYWKNVFVEVESSNTTDTSQYTNIFGAAHNHTGSMTDCYAITAGVNFYYQLSTGSASSYIEQGKAKGWDTLADMKADTSIDWAAKIAAWNTDAGIEFWTLKDGVPMAKTTAALVTSESAE